MLGNFNEEAQIVLSNAKLEMKELGHPYIGTEHLLLSILHSDNAIVSRLNAYNLTYNNFKEELCRVIGTGTKKSEIYLYTPLLRKVLESAIMDSKENNDGEVTVEHLFFSMLEEGEGIAIRTLIGMDIDIEGLYDEFSSSLIKRVKKSKKKKLLIEELGVDITREASLGKIDPVFGRDNEVKRIMEILCRRGKNNPILIGEAGVGKTAIVEELARLIANDDVPSNLSGKKIISLDMATMVAGTKYRGEFEERMKKVIKEIEDNDDIILFIDEIHTLVGAGGAEGAIDASNILKPALARGKIRCIGATTTDEYKKFIEKDSALERRFQKVIINEPTVEETRNILIKIKSIYEKYHNVLISSEVIDSILSLSEKYIFDRNRPDKEIDILDEVCSKVNIKSTDKISDAKNLRKEITKLNKEKTSYIVDNNIERAYNIRKREVKLTEKLNDLEIFNKNKKEFVTVNDVAFVISSRTNIPVYEIINHDLSAIEVMRNNITNEIIGQNKVIDALMEEAKRIKLGYNKCYSALLVGPSGVGKSKVSKLFAESLVGEKNFIRLDMSEYSDITSVNKILGSSPGYVGYDDNKNILEEIRNCPNCVILLDEVDKAHSSVINLFFQILEEGKIKDAKGRVIRFDNTIILMTCNVGFEREGIGFNRIKNNAVISELKNRFSTSFINRVDNILIFNRLTEDNIRSIINNKLDKLKNKFNDMDIIYDEELIDDIISESDYYNFGARRIDKLISKNVENVLIDAMINNRSSVNIIKKEKTSL